MVAQNISGTAAGVATATAVIRGTGQIAGSVVGASLNSGLLTYRQNIFGATSNGASGSVLDDMIETGLSMRNALRLIAAATAGKLLGAGSGTETIRNAVADNRDRIAATVDEAGNRTGIVYDLTD